MYLTKRSGVAATVAHNEAGQGLPSLLTHQMTVIQASAEHTTRISSYDHDRDEVDVVLVVTVQMYQSFVSSLQSTMASLRTRSFTRNSLKRQSFHTTRLLANISDNQLQALAHTLSSMHSGRRTARIQLGSSRQSVLDSLIHVGLNSCLKLVLF